jgi:hypothetical protein
MFALGYDSKSRVGAGFRRVDNDVLGGFPSHLSVFGVELFTSIDDVFLKGSSLNF